MNQTSGVIVFLLFALAAGGCAVQPRSSGPAAGDSQSLLFHAAVRDAAVAEPNEIHPLKPVAGERVLVLTWTDWDGYRTGPMTLGRAIWVTLAPEVRDLCRKFEGDPTLRLEQLLGLPTGAGKTHFVELRAAAEHLFRPCPDPDPTRPRCGLDFPDDVVHDHLEWMGRQMLASYQWPGGYPWTRLGYTYDWHPDSGEYGASEYLLRQGAEVDVLAIKPTLEYCSRMVGD